MRRNVILSTVLAGLVLSVLVWTSAGLGNASLDQYMCSAGDADATLTSQGYVCYYLYNKGNFSGTGTQKIGEMYISYAGGSLDIRVQLYSGFSGVSDDAKLCLDDDTDPINDPKFCEGGDGTPPALSQSNVYNQSVGTLNCATVADEADHFAYLIGSLGTDPADPTNSFRITIPTVSTSCDEIVLHFNTTAEGGSDVSVVGFGQSPPPPTSTPTNTPTDTPTNTPTNTPTDTPTDTPTNTPTNTPTDTPTNTPTNTPTDTPTNTPTPTPTPDFGDGCTPGYWKAKPHLDSWPATGYSPNQQLGTVFTFPASLSSLSSVTLLNALSFNDTPKNSVAGGAKILLQAAVAALLNAAHPDVDYELTTNEIITQVNAALASGNRATMITLKNLLDQYNNEGCTLN